MTFHQSMLSGSRRSPAPLRSSFSAFCALILTLISCSPKSTTPPSPANDSPPKLVGRIASIPPDRRFVLIESYGKWTAENGSILTTRGPDSRSANLLVTGETLGHFAAADIQSGTLDVGDAVYSRHVPKPPPDPTNPDVPPSDPPLVPTPGPNHPLEPELPSHSGES